MFEHLKQIYLQPVSHCPYIRKTFYTLFINEFIMWWPWPFSRNLYCTHCALCNDLLIFLCNLHLFWQCLLSKPCIMMTRTREIPCVPMRTFHTYATSFYTTWKKVEALLWVQHSIFLVPNFNCKALTHGKHMKNTYKIMHRKYFAIASCKSMERKWKKRQQMLMCTIAKLSMCAPYDVRTIF